VYAGGGPIIGGPLAASSTRRPSGSTSGVPQRLQVIDDFSSDQAQQVGQHTATGIAHSCQKNAGLPGL
jgi:hypothetical protein